jgi:hypothetical protein
VQQPPVAVAQMLAVKELYVDHLRL